MLPSVPEISAVRDSEGAASGVESLPVALGKRRRGRPRKVRPLEERVHKDGSPVVVQEAGVGVVPVAGALSSSLAADPVGGGTDPVAPVSVAAAPVVLAAALVAPLEDGFSMSPDWSFLRR